MTDYLDQFRRVLEERGLIPPDQIIADGRIHRCDAVGKHGRDDGAYLLHLDGVPAGGVQNHRDGLGWQNWRADIGRTLTPAEEAAHRERAQAAQALRAQEEADARHAAAGLAAQIWSQAEAASDAHPYLVRKGVRSHGLRQHGAALLVPVQDAATGELVSLQSIGASGDKRFLRGGRVRGCVHLLGELTDAPAVLLVAEGYATAASLHEATGHPVACAFHAGNLALVAQALRMRCPSARIAIAADDDAATASNPGMTAARQAAAAVGGVVAVPDFGPDRPEGSSDFNDAAAHLGLEAVRQCVEVALAAPPVPTFPALPDGDAWDTPQPLPDALPPVQAFDAELLPDALRGWVSDIAHRMQCPPDFVAVAALTGLSSLVGARAVVAPKRFDDWRVVPNLWGLVIGRPGVMKSPALAEALKPLHRLEAEAREAWQADHDEWRLDCEVAALRADADKKQAAKVAAKDPSAARELLRPADLPPEPKMRRYVVNDSTVEALGEILESAPWGTLAYRDELHGLLCSLDRQGQEGSRAFYLQAYDGDKGYTFDRIGRGTHYLPRVCLALLGGMQPGKAQSYVREAVGGGAGDDGLLQRFGLTVWPDVDHAFELVDRPPDADAKARAWRVFERLATLQPNGEEPQTWRFDDAAQTTFAEWLTAHETEIRGDELHPALVSHLAKYRKLVPALALLFALIDTPDSGRQIGEHELLRALAWAEYLRAHAERLYAAAVVPETTGARLLLDKIKGGRLCDADGVLLASFTPRLVAAKHWAGMDTPESARKAAALLVDYGWLRRELVPTGAQGGRPSERFEVHPALLKGGAV